MQGQKAGKALSQEEQAAADAAAAAAGGKGMQAVLEGLGALHDESEYKEEFAVKGFLQSLKQEEARQELT